MVIVVTIIFFSFKQLYLWIFDWFLRIDFSPLPEKNKQMTFSVIITTNNDFDANLIDQLISICLFSVSSALIWIALVRYEQIHNWDNF